MDRNHDTIFFYRYCFGLDLAQVKDFAAFAGIRRQWSVEEVQPGKFKTNFSHFLGFLKRWPKGTKYTTIISEVRDTFNSPSFTGKSKSGGHWTLPRPVLCVDATGLGRPVLDQLREECPNVIGAILSGGELPHRLKNRLYSLPKKDLAGVLQQQLATAQLTASAGLELMPALLAEIQDFRIKTTTSGHEKYESSTGKNDDLIVATGLALWTAAYVPSYSVTGEAFWK